MLYSDVINPHLARINQFLEREKKAHKVIFPEEKNIFRALNLTPPSAVKVVILGQDPYSGPGQANGLSFSVNRGMRIPPSLRNIYKELVADCGIISPDHGDLSSWAEQGVLLLNSILTVEMGKPMSHSGIGWEELTSDVIANLAKEKPIAFVLWGNYAQQKGHLIDENKHLVIKSAHPSPLSARRGFFGSRPFSKINDFLRSKGEQPIDWSLQLGLKS